jgi:hypothetical protein
VLVVLFTLPTMAAALIETLLTPRFLGKLTASSAAVAEISGAVLNARVYVSATAHVERTAEPTALQLL